MRKMKDIYLKNQEIINYIIVGGMTTLISLIVYYVCVFTFLNPDMSLELQVANVISWFAGLCFAYVANRKIVFKSKNEKIKDECLKFTASRIATLVFDMLFMLVTVTMFKMNDKIMKIISNVFVIVLNYVLSKFLVFVKKGVKE